MENKSETSAKVIQLLAKKDFVSDNPELQPSLNNVNNSNEDNLHVNNVINLKQVEINKMVSEITSLIWK